MENKKYPINWAEIRKNVLDRDNHTCQHCGCKNGEMRMSGHGKPYKVVLQVAHLDHDAENQQVKLERLLSLCQPCHLKNDREHSQALIKIAMAKEKRLQPPKGESMTRPQNKAYVKHLLAVVRYQQEQITAQREKIEYLLQLNDRAAALSSDSVSVAIAEKRDFGKSELLEEIKELKAELAKWKHKPPKIPKK